MKNTEPMTRFTRSYLPALMFCPIIDEPAVLKALDTRFEMLLILLAMPAKAETATP